jgi:hypothetical protein
MGWKKKTLWGIGIFFVLIVFLGMLGDDETPSNGNGGSEVPNDYEYVVSENPLPKGDRVLAIDISESTKGYGSDFTEAKTAGLELVQLSVMWDDIEPSKEEYVDPYNLFAAANSFYPGQVKVALMIGPIDTNNLRVPSDLKGKDFDDPEVIERYNKMIDFVFTKLDKVELQDLAIGNEIDIYLGTSSSKWEQYTEFFEQTSAHVREVKPGLPVSAKATFDGLREGKKKDFLKTFNENADAILTTYYPIKGDFSVKDMSSVEEEIEELLEIYPNKNVYFLEAGCPTSSLLGSSEETQAEFVKQMFMTWDKHKDQIKVVNFLWMHDQSDAMLKQFESYYGSSNKKFVAYLATLGYRTNDGEDKLGWKAIKAEAKARGW